MMIGNDTRDSRQDGLCGMTPVEVAACYQHLPGTVFFDSVGNFPSSAADPWSIIAACPVAEIRGSIHEANDCEALRNLLRAHADGPKWDEGFPRGGLCGSIDYEGMFSFGVYPEWFAFDHAAQTWHGMPEWIEHRQPCSPAAGGLIESFSPMTSREAFLNAVEEVRQWIAAGDIYQVNLTQQFCARCSQDVSLWSLYEALRDASPAPMSCWMNRDGRQVLGSSPETFLRVHGRRVETRPIKGTRPRHADADEDRRSAYELQTSEKEIAELVMITDLLRNDLGQVCEYGTVQVSEILQLESLAQVHHLVSTVCGTLRAEEDVVSLLAACFPGGSITGAPKKRAMEIIRELETVPRGLYCGAIGYMGFHGDAQFNLAIRTLIREGDVLHYHVGAGIVADSVAEAEYEETLHKARGIQDAVRLWQGMGGND
jgi:aminodeoxychorismate synthase component I